MISTAEQETPESKKQILHNMQAYIWNNAMQHSKSMTRRTAIMMQELDLDEFEIKPIGTEVDLEVLRDPEHPRRIRTTAGPLFFYNSADEPPQTAIIELFVLLLADSFEIRKTAAEELERQILNSTLTVTPKTRAVFDARISTIKAEDSHDWRLASISLCDAMSDDIFVALQGVRQCLTQSFQIPESLNFYVPRVIHPTISSMDTITLKQSNPENEHQRMLDIIDTIVHTAEGLTQACQLYFQDLGYIPLASCFGLTEVVSRWLDTNPDTNAWEEVWNWANHSSSPVPLYHACSVFVNLPQLIPDGKKGELWNAIMIVLKNSDKRDQENLEQEPWALRREISRHFIYHLEANIPENHGADLANFSWWVAERIASIFPDKPESVKFYREKWFKPAENQSAHQWLVSLSPNRRSYLRYLTTAVSSPWGTALLATMGTKFDELSIQEQPQEFREKFHNTFVYYLLSSLPFTTVSAQVPTYAQEASLKETAEKWAHLASEEQKKTLNQLIESSASLDTRDGLCEALRKLSTSSLTDQAAVMFALKAKTYTDPDIASAVWDVISDPEWRKTTFLTVHEQILGWLVEALSKLQVYAKEKWLSHLPHYLAEVCENTEEDDRRQVVFLLVLHTSLASETVSAVRRLIRGPQKEKFVEIVRDYREKIEANWAAYPRWTQGRLRGLLATLWFK